MTRTIIRIAALCTAILFLVVLVAGQLAAKKEDRPNGKPYRGVYLNNGYARSLPFVKTMVERGKPLGLNMFVLDAQTYLGTQALISSDVIQYLKKEGIYTAIRVVCFQDGLKILPIPEWQLTSLYKMIEEAAKCGADEVQLDYIRFEDSWGGPTIDQKYAAIDTLLAKLRTIVDKYKVKLSADVFGRVPYNRRDPIGQSLEEFAKHVDVIYPMLYPSHFTADQLRMSQPAFTVKEGTQLAVERLKGTRATVQPYIQVFYYNIGWAGVGLVRYVEMQIEGAEATAGRGWVAWNAGGAYEELWQALASLKRQREVAATNVVRK